MPNRRNKKRKQVKLQMNPFQISSAKTTESSANCWSFFTWGSSKISTTERHTLNTIEHFTQPPAPLGASAVITFQLSDLIDKNISNKWDYFRIDHVEVFCNPIMTGACPIMYQIWTSVDDDDFSSMPSTVDSLRERSNHACTMLTNEKPFAKIASWQPCLMQTASTASTDQALKRMSRGIWCDVNQQDKLTFGALRCYFVCLNGFDVEHFPRNFAQGQTQHNLPAVMTTIRAKVTLKGRQIS